MINKSEIEKSLEMIDEILDEINSRKDEITEIFEKLVHEIEHSDFIKTKTMDRDREFVGAFNTFWGERGKTFVHGLKIRDLCDCIVRSIFLCSHKSITDSGNKYLQNLCESAEKGEYSDMIKPSDLYTIELDALDPVAVIQTVMCEIEKMMGIYPNIETSQIEDDEFSDFCETDKDQLNGYHGECYSPF